ncbi:MAG: HAMP domain-containing protein, partial [Chloroflexi bacterium]|nr:HAMP domain-containing protein [Chloroflexota bacterium]
GLASSVVRPVRVLTDEAQRLAGGNLDDPVAELGGDEIGRLARSLDTMRERLRQSMDEVTRANRELEDRVRARTREVEASRNQLKGVLAKVISAEEEERKRIARELHDETSQEATALMISLDTLLAARDLRLWDLRARLQGSKALAERIVDGVQRMIFDLRPSVLDDLGLASAVRWYAESRLKDVGIDLHLQVEDEEQQLPAQIEVAVYRAFQEAITNVARHAEARSVRVGLMRSEEALVLTVDDDGKGFDLEHLTPGPDRLEGLGILGMRERLALVGGRLEIDSQVGDGTRVRIEVPLEANGGGRNEQD